jgi:hypothetical protein
MSARVGLARRVLQILSSGNPVPALDPLQLRAWALTPEDAVLSLESIAPSTASSPSEDFMLWPSARHKFGWYLEPGFDYSFGRGYERSVGVSGGLLIAIR